MHLPLLIQSAADFYKTWENDLCRHGNESTTFWEQSDRPADPH